MFITAEGTLNQSLTPVQRFGLDPFGMLREKSATPSGDGLESDHAASDALRVIGPTNLLSS
ncbi:hypothetical protein SynA1560_02247 [Synechococcus sp. A15-60]|nr:hypothetical protein SynA1560_02247 [Synechococcus sp. A15-60]